MALFAVLTDFLFMKISGSALLNRLLIPGVYKLTSLPEALLHNAKCLL